MQLINTITLKDNYTWILHNMQNKAIIFDCGDFEKLDSFLTQHNLIPEFVCITHNHWDHVDGIANLVKKYQCKIVSHETLQTLFKVDMVVKNFDVIQLLGEAFKIYEAGGHTNNQIIYHNEDKKMLFVGDVLFNLGCGLLIDGSYEAMFEDMKLIRSFDGNNKVLCGHNYLKANWFFLQSLGLEDLILEKALSGLEDNLLDFEFKHNPFLKYDDKQFKAQLNQAHEDDFNFFVNLRKQRNRFKILGK
jgi:hydroxyacylglutathione hydrolase